MDGSDDADGKADGAMLAIGELANRIGVPTHVLRYWESRFPELTPLQRSGRRRYYRAADVALAERIYDLLHVRGFTVDGARKALAEGEAAVGKAMRPALTRAQLDGAVPAAPAAAASAPGWSEPAVKVHALIELRQRLARALEKVE